MTTSKKPPPKSTTEILKPFDHVEQYRAPWDWMQLPIDEGEDQQAKITLGETLVVEKHSGRKIWMASLHQYATYGGLQAGLPRATDSYIEVALKTAKSVFSSGERPAVVLKPRLKRRAKVRVELPGKPAARLPLVTSIALFDSQPVGDKEMYRSSAIVIWFQEHFGLPSDDHILAQLQALDWPNHATDWAP
jgi:hypothetical protein